LKNILDNGLDHNNENAVVYGNNFNPMKYLFPLSFVNSICYLIIIYEIKSDFSIFLYDLIHPVLNFQREISNNYIFSHEKNSSIKKISSVKYNKRLNKNSSPQQKNLWIKKFLQKNINRSDEITDFGFQNYSFYYNNRSRNKNGKCLVDESNLYKVSVKFSDLKSDWNKLYFRNEFSDDVLSLNENYLSQFVDSLSKTSTSKLSENNSENSTSSPSESTTIFSFSFFDSNISTNSKDFESVYNTVESKIDDSVNSSKGNDIEFDKNEKEEHKNIRERQYSDKEIELIKWIQVTYHKVYFICISLKFLYLFYLLEMNFKEIFKKYRIRFFFEN
jgi:hypothetical protein